MDNARIAALMRSWDDMRRMGPERVDADLQGQLAAQDRLHQILGVGRYGGAQPNSTVQALPQSPGMFSTMGNDISAMMPGVRQAQAAPLTPPALTPEQAAQQRALALQRMRNMTIPATDYSNADFGRMGTRNEGIYPVK